MRLIALVLSFVAVLYLTGLRADRVNAHRVLTEAGQGLGRNAQASASVSTYRGHTAQFWAWRYKTRTRQLQHTRAILKHRWHPTVTYALRLASAVFQVPYRDLSSVSYCESTHNPFATNGQYRGLFQLSWAPFGLSPFDPVASALSTAATVRREGWRQWECKP